MAELCQAIADKFRGDSDAQKALALAQKRPDSKEKQSSLEEVLAKKLDSDPDFASVVQRLVDELQSMRSAAQYQQGQEVSTQTNIVGDVNEQIFSGQFNGPVAPSGEAVDFSGSKVAIYKPYGPVVQHFHYRHYYIPPKFEEIPQIIDHPPPDFTGRDAELQELLEKFESGVNIIGLRGMGGVGKTALALKLVEYLRDRYPDGQIMVDMMGTTDPISPVMAMSSVISSYHPGEKIAQSEAEIRRRYIQVLNGKRALILLDNALDDKQVLKLIPPKSCGLIITSRNTIKLSGLFRKDLDVLESGEALQLLLGIYRTTAIKERSASDDLAWPDIARLCGYLPLALRAAGSYLANSDDVSPAEYASDLKDERTRLEMIGEQGVEMSVDASFSLSFKRLKPGTQQTFLNLSIFPAEFDAQAEEQICQDERHRGLSELLRWSLVDYKPQGPDYGRYRLHELARLFASARQKDQSRAMLSERHAAYYRELLSAADDLFLQGKEKIQAGLMLFDREKDNIFSGYAWALDNMEVSSSAAELCMRYPASGAYVLDLRLHPREKIRWLQRGLDAARQLKDKGMEGVHLGNLGLAYAALGDARKAIEHYEQALDIARKIGDRRGEGGHLGNLGLAYAALGDARKAIEHYEQALAISREIGDRRGEGGHLGNLGLAYAALGDARKAIEHYEQALDISREIGDRRGEGGHLGNLGNAYYALGDARKAIEHYEQALDIARETEDKRREAIVCWNLGLEYEKAGDLERAADLMQVCVDFERKIGHPDGEKDAQRLDDIMSRLKRR